jgi:hypothetical protein
MQNNWNAYRNYVTSQRQSSFTAQEFYKVKKDRQDESERIIKHNDCKLPKLGKRWQHSGTGSIKVSNQFYPKEEFPKKCLYCQISKAKKYFKWKRYNICITYKVSIPLSVDLQKNPAGPKRVEL